MITLNIIIGITVFLLTISFYTWVDKIRREEKAYQLPDLWIVDDMHRKEWNGEYYDFAPAWDRVVKKLKAEGHRENLVTVAENEAVEAWKTYYHHLGLTATWGLE